MALPTREQLSALADLWEMAKRDHGGAKVVGRFLLGLYNGRRFPFDLTDLRCLDQARFEQCIEVLRMDYTPRAEVHVLLGIYLAPDGSPLGFEFESLAYRLGVKGRCTKGALAELERSRVARRVAP